MEKDKKTITVIVAGGLIQEILDIPSDIEVVVKDYDTEGSDENWLAEDDNGKKCLVSVW